jgi:hypothetical protein
MQQHPFEWGPHTFTQKVLCTNSQCLRGTTSLKLIAMQEMQRTQQCTKPCKDSHISFPLLLQAAYLLQQLLTAQLHGGTLCMLPTHCNLQTSGAPSIMQCTATATQPPTGTNTPATCWHSAVHLHTTQLLQAAVLLQGPTVHALQEVAPCNKPKPHCSTSCTPTALLPSHNMYSSPGAALLHRVHLMMSFQLFRAASKLLMLC